MQGKRRKIDEIVHWYIEEILLKFDTAMRSLDEAREVYCLFFNVLFIKYIEISIYVALLEVLSDASKK